LWMTTKDLMLILSNFPKKRKRMLD
jgi:hypothetical protein